MLYIIKQRPGFRRLLPSRTILYPAKKIIQIPNAVNMEIHVLSKKCFDSAFIMQVNNTHTSTRSIRKFQAEFLELSGGV